ncbi:hypothetical protein GGI07_000053 [Coemansia sp. Benny D115]|nr:hypothetical protein GGI07_000053 [Coemansia sp. Benny D115]
MVGIYYPLASSLFSNGLFAGLGYTMNFVSVPCIKASPDPLNVFATNLEKAAKIGILTSIVGADNQVNTRIILTKYAPKGVNDTSYFKVDRSQTVPKPETLKEGQVLVKAVALSIDPHLRIYITEPEDKKGLTDDNYQSPLGEPILTIGAGIVIASNSPNLKVGDKVRGKVFSWQEYAVLQDSDLTKLPSTDRIPLEKYIGVLGMPAFTAYLGVVTLGESKAGETLLVSAASGAVGQVVVQLAKKRGLRVVGIAGSDDKVEYVRSIGADAAINYKTCGNYVDAIKAAAPEGIDVYFDAVGGELLDAALFNLNQRGRVLLCGSMTTFSADRSKVQGIKNIDRMIMKQGVIKGLFYQPYEGTQVQTEFFEEMSQLVDNDEIEFKVDERNGLESAPQALADTYMGRNFGKVVVKL